MFQGARLYVDPDTQAARQAAAWRESRPDDAALIDKIAAQPQAMWLCGEGALEDLARRRDAIVADGGLPVFVAYNIPDRDMGQHSAGGAAGAGAYLAWVDSLVGHLKGMRCVVVLEPDSLALVGDPTSTAGRARFALIRSAAERLKSLGSEAVVYLDGGHARWHKAEEMAARLREAGVDIADGFALNVSNFIASRDSVWYGEAICESGGGREFIVDVSRNGSGPQLAADGALEWCNPPGRALGRAPTFSTGHTLAAAYLWIKRPGESDGECNGGPKTGEWWADYALELARSGAPITSARTARGAALPRRRP